MNEPRVRIRDIAEELGLSTATVSNVIHGKPGKVSEATARRVRQLLEQLVAKLKKAGLVISSRGAQGGYKLAKPAKEISVGDVLRAVEGSLDAANCPGVTGGICQDSQLCVSKHVWKKINDSIVETVDGIKLDTLVEESRAAREKYKE